MPVLTGRNTHEALLRRSVKATFTTSSSLNVAFTDLGTGGLTS